MIQRRTFCRELSLSMLRRRGFEKITPEEIFGPSDIDDVEEGGEMMPYEKGSSEWHLIKEVASWDHSLATLLREKHIDPDDPAPSSVRDKDSILRKARPIAALRKKFTKVGRDGALRRRTRKSGGEFCGVPAIYDLSDGNPRRLMRICDEMCQESRQEKPIPREVQSRVILGIASVYRDYLMTIPGGQVQLPASNARVDLYSLLREIGRYFSSGLLLGPFPLDPKSSFTIDPATEDYILPLLRLASYHGAIVRVDSNAPSLGSDIRGARFRLCYTLSPLLQLPLRLYDPISLSSCLGAKRRYVKPIQLELSIKDEGN
jgi:hypothetical protein